MDFKKFSSDANTFFSRALQKTEEALKTTDKTLLDANLENSIKQCEMRQRWASGLIQMIENVIQPNPAIRMEDMVLKGFDRKKERLTTGEVLGDTFSRIGNELGSGTPHGKNHTQFLKIKERTKLEEARLDLDRSKTLLKRARDDAAKKTQIEQQLNEAQTLFNRQCDVTRKVMDHCISKFDEHKSVCKAFLRAQLQYYQSCVDHVEGAIQSL
ncbi:hypothetical protein FGIG_03778 [Fasciola gigantica]|uniref:BAR domain-containing protein n=1 Tax=Fasciola gigantica TaxID=46835 RepID=A0A504YSN0_FASGI|nr:hypothetical protein FGIG_03778 [Fasciola gigantica]